MSMVFSYKLILNTIDIIKSDYKIDLLKVVKIESRSFDL